jgi:hypothetical protein
VVWLEGYDDVVGPVVPAGSAIQSFGPAHPITLAAQPSPLAERWGEYTFHRTAPFLCPGAARGGEPAPLHGELVLLGELGKFVSVSAQRITAITPDCDKLTATVHIVGRVGESVTMWFLAALGNRESSQPVAATAIVGPGGTATITFKSA